jgi:hypothetical protein
MTFMSSMYLQSRKYIMHPAHTTVGVSFGLPIVQCDVPAIKTRNILFIGGPDDQPLAKTAEKHLYDFFSDEYCLEIDRISVKAHKSLTVDINPNDIDCILLIGHQAAMNNETLEMIYDYWQCGGSLAAVRVADFSLHGSDNFANDIFGGQYEFEHLLSPVNIDILSGAGHHPLLRGIKPFISRGGLHRYDCLPNDATPILFAEVDDYLFPTTWVRSKLGRRVFATTLGAEPDFRHPIFLQLLSNAVLWAAH